MRQLVKGIAEAVVSRLPSRAVANCDLVLAYHNVIPDFSQPKGDASLHLNQSAFERQIEVLANETQIVPLMEILNDSPTSIRRSAITFDDAYHGALAYGVQACAARDLPCTVFVSPGLLGTVPIWDILSNVGKWTAKDRADFLNERIGNASHAFESKLGFHDLDDGLLKNCRIATFAELAELLRHPNVTLGNHTYSHLNCSNAPAALLRDDIVKAAVSLSELFGTRALPVLAYPYGLRPTDRLRQETILEACRFALTIDGGWAQDKCNPLAVPRINVPRGLSDAAFVATLRGWKR